MVEKAAVVEALKDVHDPEIPVNVYDLGLVYEIEIDDDRVEVEMTLTSPTCPIAGQIVAQAERALETVDGVTQAAVELVWDPPWSPEMASETGTAKLEAMGIPMGSPDSNDRTPQSPF